MKLGTLLGAAVLLTAPVGALAWGGGPLTKVPEIDALSGAAALAAIAAAGALTWERRRKR